jgi:hypothetical protein
MFFERGGDKVEVQGLVCHLCKPGYVFNRRTGQVEFRGIQERSRRPEEQYWERTPEPLWYKIKRKAEETLQAKQLAGDLPITYVDPECEAYREEQWDKRLNGMWYMNGGKPTYITGLHWMFMSHWQIDIGYPSFRVPDQEYFYFLQYCIEDPNCMGMIEITKRRFGKTFRSGLFLYEYTSRNKNANSGLQSKTDMDAKRVFSKAIVKPFKRLPHFFRPEYDRSQGITPKSELRFEQTNVRGKKAESTLDKDELNSLIDFQPSEPMSYDGQKLHRYVRDEFGKSKKIDIYESHEVVRYCMMDDEGRIIGKMLYTTTVEEMEKGGANAKLLWDESDQSKIQQNGRTQSGLYRFFMPADRTRNFDRHGFPNVALNREIILKDRASQSNVKSLSQRIRKEPLTIEEAFRIDGKDCMFNDVKLNNRISEVMPSDWERGNLQWRGGKRDNFLQLGVKGAVEWVPNPNGLWIKNTAWQPMDGVDVNVCELRGERLFPTRDWDKAMGADPYDHDVTEDGRRSLAACHMKLKAYPRNMTSSAIGGYALTYHGRPAIADLFYEDILMMVVYCGCKVLCEDNKQGLIKYFRWRGYGQFLMHIAGYKDVGIPSTERNKQTGAEMVEALIETNVDSIVYTEQLRDWLLFNIRETKKFDLSMASLWTEWAAVSVLNAKKPPEPTDVDYEEETIDSLFDSYDIAA